MTKEEYEQKKDALIEKFKREKRTLDVEYAMSNNTVKIGDFVTNHLTTIKVERIGVLGINEPPKCIYYGTQYTKSGQVAKRQVDTTVHQSCLKEINGEKYMEL